MAKSKELAGYAKENEAENGGGRTVARGKAAVVGDTRVAKNGYHYTKTDDGWVLTHWLTAAKKLGRPIADNEQVRFVDKKYKDDPTNPDGVIVIQKRKSSLRRRRAQIEARIEELLAEKAIIDAKLGDDS